MTIIGYKYNHITNDFFVCFAAPLKGDCHALQQVGTTASFRRRNRLPGLKPAFHRVRSEWA
jgi:hypothetical protein